MDPKEIVTFVNITDKPFVGMWGGEKFPMKPRQESLMELWKALHFAKHLVDVVLNDRGIPTNTQGERDTLVKFIIKNVQQVSAPEEAEEETVDVPEAAPEEEMEEAPRGAVKKVGRPSKAQKEQEFADLKN